MASAPSDPKPVLGRVDRDGRLVAADPELEQLQLEAGSSLGGSLALPQLAAIVRVAQRLQIPVSRRVLAAGKEQDVDMWVRAVPDGDDIALTIDRWSARPASPPRLTRFAAAEPEALRATTLNWAVDEQLRVLTIAPPLAELLSTDSAAAAGQPLTKLFQLTEDENGEMPLLIALASRTSFSGQRVTARDGEQQLILNGEPALGPDGAFAGFDGSAAAADEACRAMDTLPVVDTAVHTALHSPLNAIVRSAEDMIDRPDGRVRDEYADYASDIAAAARHLLSVIRSLSEQSESPSRSQVDLPELASEAVGLIEAAAKQREIVIAVEPRESLIARGESRPVIQILVNLIGNAVRYSDERTAVTISFEAANGTAMVHISDQGPGIDPADHERIFEPFQQGKGGNGGSGLGLSIARRLARTMDGDIQLQSMPGEGSRFTLVLPAA